MPYFSVPADVEKSTPRLRTWAREAIAVAHAAKQATKKKPVATKRATKKKPAAAKPAAKKQATTRKRAAKKRV